MRVFVAGATGAIGKRLVPALVGRGHEVTGSTRSPDKVEQLAAMGAEAAVMDALDPEQVKAAVVEAEPHVVVHQLTAIPDDFNPKRFEEVFAPTNRLRTEGTDHLIEAARAAGARRFVTQSFGATPYERRGGAVKTETDPFDPNPVSAMRPTFEAMLYAERAALESGLEGIALRYGGFYGPGTSIATDGSMVEAVRKRRLPIVGSGGGVWSFIHIDDATAATVAAIEGGEPGVYNVVDDEPAPVREWLPVLAEAVGAKPPRRVPLWLARPLIGPAGVMLMTEVRGASNAKAKGELRWMPAYPTWREGFRTGLG